MEGVLKGAFIFGSVLLYALIAGVLLRRSTRNKWVVFLLAVWLGLVDLLGRVGFFLDFQAVPPRIPLFVLIEVLSIFWLVFASPFREELVSIPQRVLVGAQTFRIGVELILGSMATNGLLPLEMSFHGRNFDVLTGVSAIGVTVALLAVGELRLKKILLAWNILGLSLLFWVVGHGMLSAPYPFQVLHLSRSNSEIGRFPFIWLPLFWVPLALTLHILSLRRLMRFWNSAEEPLDRPGAGLPFFEAWVGRYLAVKRLPFQKSWDEHLAEFEKETQRIVRILQTFDEKESWQRVLVPRVVGLEDSSRLWSPRMVVEHLEIVEGGISRIIQGLLVEELTTAVDIATLKPNPGLRTESSGTRYLHDFEEKMKMISVSLRKSPGDRESQLKANHPWFHAMTARQWVWLLGAHQRIHRRQLELIARGLGR